MIRQSSSEQKYQPNYSGRKNAAKTVFSLPKDELLAPPDSLLATTTMILVAIGIVSVYSAGSSKGFETYGSSSHFLIRQFCSALVGLFAMIYFSKISLAKLEKITVGFGLLTLLLLIAVLIPGIGSEIKGARRWINLGFGFRFQPSEFARLASALMVARYVSKFSERVCTLSGILKCMVLPLIYSFLILLQPDFDTAFTVLAIGCVILFVAGVPWRYVLIGAGAAVLVAILLIWKEPYRMDRIMGFLDPWSDPRRKGYQIIQCWIAMGSGGIFGKGLGASIQKLGFLPEAHTDFIFAVIAEELGFVIASLIVVLFGIISWKGYRIAIRQSIPFARYVAIGITAMVSMQAGLNLMVVSGLAPTTGVPLPFVSYGGTSLIFMMSSLGILWGIARRVS